MLSTANTPSIFTQSQLPSVFLQEAPNFVQFIEYYYEWMEQYENPTAILRKLEFYRDVDKIPSKFYLFLRAEFMKNIPNKNNVDEAILLKNIKDFYRSKGSEKATKLLFRILYNEEIDFYYPGNDILKTSDGRWFIERSLKIDPVVSNDILLQVTSIKGQNSGATARVERAMSYIVDAVETNEIFINAVVGTFRQGERIVDTVTGTPIATILSDGVVSYPGKYLTTHGFLSADKYLQDSYYYQEYSYEIKSSRSINDYRNVLTSVGHVSGTKMFGSIQVLTDFNIVPDLNVNNSFNVFLQIMNDYSFDVASTFDFQTSADFTDPVPGGKYIFELDLDFRYNKKYVHSWNVVAETVTSSGNLIVGAANTNFSTLGLVGKTVEVTNDVTKENFYAKIDALVANNTLRMVYTNPYMASVGGQLKMRDVEDPAIETTVHYNKYNSTAETLDVIVDDRYTTWANTLVHDFRNMPINAFTDGRLIRSSTDYFGNIKRGNFLEFSDVTNSFNSVQLVGSELNSEYAIIRDPYPYGATIGINFNHIISGIPVPSM